MPTPTGTPAIVGTASDRVGKDSVRGDDEAVSFKPYGVGNVTYIWVGVSQAPSSAGLSVRVVEFYELVEAAFGVGVASLAAEDLVWCWMLMARLTLGPVPVLSM